MSSAFNENTLKRKRTSSRSLPKLENGNSDCSNKSSDSAECLVMERKDPIPIMSLPTEMIMKVFEYVPAADLSNNVRLVNCRFKAIAEKSLNLKLRKLNSKLKSLINRTYSHIKVVLDDQEIIRLCTLLNFAETLGSENNVITGKIWRSNFKNFYGATECCMYGGLILDEEEQFIRTFEKEIEMDSSSISISHELPEQVKRIGTLIKSFYMNFDQIQVTKTFSKKLLIKNI